MFPLRAVIFFAREFFFEDDSDEEVQNVIEKVENYAEITVPNMVDYQFKRHFRVNPSTFDILLGKMSIIFQNERHSLVGFPRTELQKELLITLWYLSNIESFRSVADRFGVSKSTAWDILYRTCKLLLIVNQRYKIICWPDRNRQTIISNNFVINGFPDVIGCIDGSHIKILAPKEHPNSYVNRKNYHSVLLQGVCDHEMLFTNVYAGEVGSLHDFTLYRRSELYRNLQNNTFEIFGDKHLVGDLAYKLSSILMVGFKNNGHLTRRERNFNIVLNKSRVKIENAFAHLKGRFRRLRYIEARRMDIIAMLIVCGCIVHNVCILQQDRLDELGININEEIQRERENNPHNHFDLDEQQIANEARRKREAIMNMLRLRY